MRQIHDNRHISDLYWEIWAPTEGIFMDTGNGIYRHVGIGQLEENNRLNKGYRFIRKRGFHLNKDSHVYASIQDFLRRHNL